MSNRLISLLKFSFSLSSHISKTVADFFFSFLLQMFFLVQVMQDVTNRCWDSESVNFLQFSYLSLPVFAPFLAAPTSLPFCYCKIQCGTKFLWILIFAISTLFFTILLKKSTREKNFPHKFSPQKFTPLSKSCTSIAFYMKCKIMSVSINRLSCARVSISPTPQSPSPKLETTRSLEICRMYM